MKVSTQLMIVLLLTSTSLSAAIAAPAGKALPAKGQSKSPAGAKKPGPAAAASSKAPAGSGASAGSSAAFNTYANQLRQKMGSSWNYPSGKNHVTLTIQVGQDGSVSNLTLASSPKNNEAEQKANDAFNSAQPLQALPSGVSEATITAIFESQADQWDSKANISVKIDPTKTAAPAGEAKSSDSTDSEKKEDKK